MMMIICIKQPLSNIWSSVHEKVKQHWGWVENNVAYKKNVYLFVLITGWYKNITCDITMLKSKTLDTLAF